MMLKSNLDIVNTRVTILHKLQSKVCEINNSSQISKSTLQSILQSVSCENDTFSILSDLESHLQKDVDYFLIMAKS